jgi:hypothetical protein
MRLWGKGGATAPRDRGGRGSGWRRGEAAGGDGGAVRPQDEDARER